MLRESSPLPEPFIFIWCQWGLTCMSCYNHTDVISHLTIAECSYNNSSPFFAFWKITCIFSRQSTEAVRLSTSNARSRSIRKASSVSGAIPPQFAETSAALSPADMRRQHQSILLGLVCHSARGTRRFCWIKKELLSHGLAAGWGGERHKTGNPNTQGDYKSSQTENIKTAMQPSWWKRGCTVDDGILGNNRIMFC